MMALLAGRFGRRKVFTWLAVPSVVGALLFTAGWLIAGRVQDHYNPRSDYISSLAAVDAANPWIIIATLMMFGLGVMSLGAGLVFSLEDFFGRVGALGIFLSGVGVLMIGMMRHDCGVQLPACAAKVSMGEISSFHAVHDVASATTFVVAGASQLLISRSVHRWVGWRYLRVPSVLSGSVTLVLFALMSSHALPGWMGAMQRVIVVVASLWVTTLGVHLYRIGAHDGSSSDRAELARFADELDAHRGREPASAEISSAK